MGEFAGVPIEPKEQTSLLDACLAIPGVVAGGVPGGTSISPKSHNPYGELILAFLKNNGMI